MVIELDLTQATLISDLTSKLLLEMQHNMVNEDKKPTNLLKYAEQCKQVYQKLKKISRLIAASKQYKKKRIATNLGLITFPARKTTTSTTTMRTMSFTIPVSWQLTISE